MTGEQFGTASPILYVVFFTGNAAHFSFIDEKKRLEAQKGSMVHQILSSCHRLGYFFSVMALNILMG